jgi:hypothetical protein
MRRPPIGVGARELGLGQGSRLCEEVDGDEADQAARDRDRLASGACAGWRRPHAPLAPIARKSGFRRLRAMARSLRFRIG